jgi:hypothetical protein
MGGKTRIRDLGDNKNINIRLADSEAVFKKLQISPRTTCLMDVKKAIFKLYGLPAPETTNRDSRKTLSEQRPNNAYGIPISDNELKLFMEKFRLTEDDWFQKNICGKITDDILQM